VQPPRVSVICVFHNGERFLAEAVESVFSQDFQDFELLLIDDGSTDSGPKTAREFAASSPGKVRYLQHESGANLGASPTRNLGLKHAQGEFIAFIDADDRWRPGKLAEQLAIFQSNPEAAMVCGTVNYWSSWEGGDDRAVPTGHLRDGISLPPSTILEIYPLGFADAPCPSDVMIRRAIIEEIGGYESEFIGPLQMYEDQAFFAKIYLRAAVYFSTRTWLDYRIHGDSCVANVRRQGLHLEVRRYFLDWLERYVASQHVPCRATIHAAIRRARWEFGHPAIGRPARWLRRLASTARVRFRSGPPRADEQLAQA
jgi:glycosyltransferase involved in cell wall biosynthesis